MTFTPQLQYITAITLGRPTVVEFLDDHDYVLGEIVSFRISQPFGTTQLNNQQSTVINTTHNTITVDIDSTYYTPFVYPVTGLVDPPITVPAGSGIEPYIIPATVTLKCPFDNKPPP